MTTPSVKADGFCIEDKAVPPPEDIKRRIKIAV